jgi:nitroreductase
MADTLTTLKTRRSCRAYKPDHVEEEKLNAIIEAGTYAATGMGKQSPIILVIKDQAVRDQLAKLNAAAMGMDIDPFYGAPELLVVLANKAMPTYIYDGSLVMGNMMNAAADLGVASCWVHRAKEEFESKEGKAILKKLGIEGDYEGIGNLILGYASKPAANAAPRKENYVYCI